ncbi:MAG: Flp pilus assembly complex ATPase component TadA [Candidatus Riflebacteria bacterium]|nr:Flp pilus assembly complex ATPase component TadA [Candidatus Riflebacteria bacterium]
MDLEALIGSVHSQGGSEIHLKVDSPPLMRKNKNLQRLSMPAIMAADMESVVKKLLSAEDQAYIREKQYFENNFFGAPPCNFRLCLFKTQGQIQAIIRIIRSVAPSLQELGFPAQFGELINARSGLIIISGPARSGISTSLAALIEHINMNRACHILLMEDPIEFGYISKRAIISQRQLRKDVHTVEQGINFAKRMDVDVLVIGDLKKEVPLRTLLEYANGGHLVILTMQTLGAMNTLEKILISFPEAYREHICNMLSRDLLGICSQALLFSHVENRMMPIHDILMVNHTVRSIIQKGRISQIESNISSAGEGSRLFDGHLVRLMRDNKISKETSDGFLTMYRGVK